jgi:hypothetical protein
MENEREEFLSRVVEPSHQIQNIRESIRLSLQDGRVDTQVKGSMVLGYVKTIRANKQVDWGQYLRPSDWEIIQGSVLASTWYPFEFYCRLGIAIFKEVAHSDLNRVREFGRRNIPEILQIYKNILVPGNPEQSLLNLAEHQEMLMQGNPSMKAINLGPQSVRYRIRASLDRVERPLLEAFCYQIAGGAEVTAERAGGQEVTSRVLPAGDSFELELTWKSEDWRSL